MRWKGRRRSDNVDDRRGVRMSPGGIGLGALVLAALAYFVGGDPTQLIQLLTEAGAGAMQGGTATEGAERSAEENEVAAFSGVVLADTEDVWNDLFARAGQTYREPTLVMFTGAVQSACGFQSAAVGPFYCPGDSNLYIDLEFFAELQRKLGAPGDFAQAYVIAHEVGHHVQNLLGTSDMVHQQQQRVSKSEANDLSVRLELQADFFAGVWAHHAQRTKDILEPGDLEEALGAASAVGDDTLQKRSTGRVVPDSFTHGSSEQRKQWFQRGFETANPNRCNTFDEVQYF